PREGWRPPATARKFCLEFRRNTRMNCPVSSAMSAGHSKTSEGSATAISAVRRGVRAGGRSTADELKAPVARLSIYARCVLPIHALHSTMDTPDRTREDELFQIDVQCSRMVRGAISSLAAAQPSIEYPSRSVRTRRPKARGIRCLHQGRDRQMGADHPRGEHQAAVKTAAAAAETLPAAQP